MKIDDPEPSNPQSLFTCSGCLESGTTFLVHAREQPFFDQRLLRKALSPVAAPRGTAKLPKALSDEVLLNVGSRERSLRPPARLSPYRQPGQALELLTCWNISENVFPGHRNLGTLKCYTGWLQRSGSEYRFQENRGIVSTSLTILRRSFATIHLQGKPQLREWVLLQICKLLVYSNPAPANSLYRNCIETA